MTIESKPPGADVAARLYGSDPNAWETLGKTPLKTRIPDAWFVFRVTHPGSSPMLFIDQSREWSLTLPSAGSVPPDMVPVPAGGAILGWPLKIPASPGLPLDEFLIDRHETTNEQFKRFVDAGGYEQRRYWKEPFIRDGRVIPWEEAITSFRDTTCTARHRRLGPSEAIRRARPTILSSGVSWYEAAAYAEFAGKSLPTIYHWNLAAQTDCAAVVVTGSNFRDAGTQAVGLPGTLSGFGTNDMAGNVKEWCWNETTAGRRCILGGGFGEATYMFNQTDARSPWHREPNFGFRLVKLRSPASAEAAARKDLSYRDFSKERPPSDEIYRALKGLYAYDANDPRARVESTQSAESWTWETVSLDAAYGGERFRVHLLLPRRARPPFQAVVFAGGANTILGDQWDPSWTEGWTDFFVQTGRALVVPVFKGMWERRDGLMPGGPGPNTPASWRDHMIATSKDLRRVVDYLETRPDIDGSRLAYHGFSYGGGIAPILLATEDRIKAAILWSPGFWMQRALPEAEPFTFISRVRIPILMLSERYDNNFSDEAAQVPFFQALGTPVRDKRRIVAVSGHGAFPRKELIRESLDFLDKYLGPVAR